MTNPQKSHITLLVDRSGSMSRNRTDAEGAVNAFIEEQKKLPLACTLLFADFDTPLDGDPGEVFPRIIHDGDLQVAPTYSLHPRGNTALIDAIGLAITKTGERLAAMSEADRPGQVFFVVQTDGEENSSRDWKLPFLIETIKQQEQDYNWTFIFLGMGPDAFAQSQMFVGTRMVHNTTQSADSGASYVASYGHVADNVNRSRGGQHVNSYAAKVDEEGVVTTPDNA